MRDSWFGDSYDIVKRYFIGELKAIGYQVVFDPSFMVNMREKKRFYHFIGAAEKYENKSEKTAIVLDPDTGIGKGRKQTHVSLSYIIEKTDHHDIVLTFDQSFSRSVPKDDQMERKLTEAKDHDRYGFYYDSHAPFLFVARKKSTLQEIKQRLTDSGLPKERLIELLL